MTTALGNPPLTFFPGRGRADFAQFALGLSAVNAQAVAG